ncbi:unnamed protein product, partial [Brassica rapa subsp. narinosa]
MRLPSSVFLLSGDLDDEIPRKLKVTEEIHKIVDQRNDIEKLLE